MTKQKMIRVMKSKAHLFNYLVCCCIAFVFASCHTYQISESLFALDGRAYPKPLEANDNFLNAAKAGNASKCRELLNPKPFLLPHRANINSTDKLGQSALMWAAWLGNSDVVMAILEEDETFRKTKKRGRHKKYYLDYSARSKDNYNPLFALIMANGMLNDDRLKCIDKLLENERIYAKPNTKKELLLTKDNFEENALHKAVRSDSPECLDLLITKLKERNKEVLNKDILKEAINALNGSRETPLMLAIKRQNVEMVRLLVAEEKTEMYHKDKNGVSLAVLAYGRGDSHGYEIFLEIIKGMLIRYNKQEKDILGTKEEREKRRKEGARKYYRKDEELQKIMEEYRHRVEGEQNRFLSTYDRFIDPNVKDPLALGENEFGNKKNEFVSRLLSAKTIKDIEAVRDMIQENPFLLRHTYKREKNGIKTGSVTALALAIESQNDRIFDLIFNSITDMTQLRSMGAYKDHLHCAIQCKNTNAIKKLLDYNSNRTGIIGNMAESLMSPKHINPNPIEIYLADPNPDLPVDKEILKHLLNYYKSELVANNFFVAPILEASLKHNNQDLLLLLYDSSSPKSEFYTIEKIDKRYMQYILIEKGFFTALNMFIQNSDFIDRHWYNAKDGKKECKRELEEALKKGLKLEDFPAIKEYFDNPEYDIVDTKELWNKAKKNQRKKAQGGKK